MAGHQTQREQTPAEIVEQQAADAQTAAERRSKQEAQAQSTKAQAEAGGPPPERRTQAGDIRYNHSRLVGAEAEAITGYPAHVVAGALHDSPDAYLTREEAAAKAAAFLQRTDSTGGA